MQYRIKHIRGENYLYKKVLCFFVPCYTLASFMEGKVISRIKHPNVNTLIAYCKAMAQFNDHKFQKFNIEVEYTDVFFIPQYDI